MQGDVRELRESVIQVALDHMVDSLHSGAPADDEQMDGAAGGIDHQSSEHGAGEDARPGDSVAHSAAAGKGLFKPLQELPVNDNTGAHGFSGVNSQAMGKGAGGTQFDPDELLHLQPVAAEEGDEFDDMLC